MGESKNKKNINEGEKKSGREGREEGRQLEAGTRHEEQKGRKNNPSNMKKKNEES